MPLSIDRWHEELRMMDANFPQFRPFAEPPWFGFQGFLRGPQTGRKFEIVIEGNERLYPQMKPAVYMNPRLGPHWVTPEYYGWSGRPQLPQLCLDSLDWKPSRSSFANMLLRVISYLGKWDG